MRGWFQIAVAFVGICCVTQASGNVDARIDVDAREIPWHKTVTFSIVVEAPVDAEISIGDMRDHFGGLMQFGDPITTNAPLPDGRKRITQTYTLEAPKAEPGKFQPDPVTITVKGGDIISLPCPEITVRQLTQEEEQQAQRFAPALDPLNVPKRFWEYWQFWAGVSVTALLLTLAYALYRWHKRGRPGKPQRIAPPWETALARLASLEAKGWREAGKLEPYYVELSAILRHYIEDRFNLHAPERTTPEFLIEASTSGKLTDEHQRMLASFLRYSDRVKFAKLEPTAEDAARNYTEVKRFVEETVPAPPPTEAAA